MTRRSQLICLAVALLGLARQAHGDEPHLYQCAHNAPGSPLLTCLPAAADAEEPPTLQAPAAPQAPAPAAPAPRTLDGRTHNFIAPTGELVPRGDVQLQIHEFGLYNRLAIGVTDRVELAIGAPVIPILGSIGARVGLTGQDSPYRLVLGGSVMVPFVESDGVLVYSASATAAYHTERMNVHGTVAMFGASGEDERIGVLSAGVTYQVGPKIALMADLSTVSLVEEREQWDCAPTTYSEDGYYGTDACTSSSRTATDSIAAPMIGIKVLGAHFDTDVGLIFPGEGDEILAVPVLSMTYKY